MTSTLLGLVLLLGSLGAAAALLARRRSARPRVDDAQLVRVPARVITQHPVTLRWTIRYPLPDGSPHDLLVERTLPEKLQEGMPVAVLVDPVEPTRARLDLPGRDRFVRGVLVAVAATFLGVLLLGGLAAASLVSLD